MRPAQLLYDSSTDELVVRVPAAEGEGDVELLRLDIRSLTADDKRRLREVRDPSKDQFRSGAQ